MTVKAEIYEPLALHHFTLIALENPGTDPHTHATGSVPSLVVGLPPLEFDFLAPASSTAMEKTVSQARPVELKLVGEPIGGVDVRSADFSPRQVRIAGARSRVERTAHVVVTADPARLAPGVPVSIAVHALDSSGAPVEGIAITPRRITVTAVAAPSPPRQTKEQPSA